MMTQRTSPGRLKEILIAVLMTPWILGASGCPNAYEEFADQTSDEALFFKAQTEIDIPDYNRALATLTKASPKGLSTRRGRLVRASAYAGRCGLDLLDLATRISNIGTATLYSVLLPAFRSVATASTAPADCLLAEQDIVAIPASAAKSDDYVFLTFNSFAKIGTLLAKVADTDDDGLIDPSFDPCTTMTDADVRQIGTGLTLAILGITNSGITLNTGSAFTDLCARLAVLSGTSSICTKTAAASFSAAELLALRSMMKGNEIGFNTCGGSTGSSSSCSCF